MNKKGTIQVIHSSSTVIGQQSSDKPVKSS